MSDSAAGAIVVLGGECEFFCFEYCCAEYEYEYEHEHEHEHDLEPTRIVSAARRVVAAGSRSFPAAAWNETRAASLGSDE